MKKRFSNTIWSGNFRREKQLRNYARNQAEIKENRKAKTALRRLDFMPAGRRFSHSF